MRFNLWGFLFGGLALVLGVAVLETRNSAPVGLGISAAGFAIAAAIIEAFNRDE
jgi:hypothetical protein